MKDKTRKRIYTSCEASFLPFELLLGSSSGLMWGTTPPWEMTTLPKSLFNLKQSRSMTVLIEHVRKYVLFIVPDGELKVARDDTLLLVVTSGIARKFEDLSSKVLQDGGEVD